MLSHRVDRSHRRRGTALSPGARENFRRRVNHAFCSGQLRRLSHPACVLQDTRIRLPTRSRLRSDAHLFLLAAPHPRPRLVPVTDTSTSASLHPPAPVGVARCGVYQEQPCPALLRISVHWTVGISPLGVGLTGRGNSFPLPCFSRSNHPASRRSHPSLWQGTRIPRRQPPARASAGIPGYLAGTPHPARACGAPPPPAPGGGVRARLFSGISPCTGPWRTSLLGEAACGEEAEPSPLSLTPSGPRTSRRPCLSLRRREPGFLPAIPARGLPIQNPARDLQQLDRMGAAATKDK